MIASVLNTLLGLWLVYAAVLDPGLLETSPWMLLASAVALVVLGLWACSADYLKWPGITCVVLGAGLIVLLISGARTFSMTLTFWVTFWTGVIAGVLSAWSVVYRRESEESPDVEARAAEPASQS